MCDSINPHKRRMYEHICFAAEQSASRMVDHMSRKERSLAMEVRKVDSELREREQTDILMRHIQRELFIQQSVGLSMWTHRELRKLARELGLSEGIPETPKSCALLVSLIPLTIVSNNVRYKITDNRRIHVQKDLTVDV